MKILIATIGLFSSLTAYANEREVIELISIKNLEVVKVVSRWNYSELELRSEAESVLVSCPDLNGLGVKSSIKINYLDSIGRIQERIYGGDDFYCYGAIDLAQNVIVGILISFDLTYSNAESGQLVSLVNLLKEDDSLITQYDFNKQSATRWKLISSRQEAQSDK